MKICSRNRIVATVLYVHIENDGTRNLKSKNFALPRNMSISILVDLNRCKSTQVLMSPKLNFS